MNPPLINFRIDSNNECIFLHFLLSGYTSYEILYRENPAQLVHLLTLDTYYCKVEIVASETDFDEITKLLKCTIPEIIEIIKQPFSVSPSKTFPYWHYAGLQIIEDNY